MTDKSHDIARQIDLQRMSLAIFLVTAFVACIMILFFKLVPAENKDLITYMIGQLSGMATMALGFYFVNKAGQDAQDAKRTENTGKMADAVVAAASAAGSGGAGPAQLKQAAEEAAGVVADAAVTAAEEVTETAQARADEMRGEGR